VTSSGHGRRRSRISPFAAGVLLIVVVAIGLFFGFTKRVPFKHRYTVTAVVKTSNLLGKGSPVRIAGVNVGKVVGSGRYKDSDLAQITMEIQDDGRPLRKDATLKIRPRLFLEGNFYVDLQPGSPDAPELLDGGVIPVSRTAVPVQLDQLLASLQTDTRKALQRTVQGLGDGFGSTPTAAEDASQDPQVQGLTGGQALNETLASSGPALRDSATVLNALGGRRNGDLSKAIEGLGDVTAALAQDQGALRGLVRGFNTTVSTTADNAADLTAAVQGLATTATTAKTTFAQLTKAIPPTRAFARDTTAAMRVLPATIDAARPWLAQARPLLSDAELGGLLDDLQPTLTNTARLTRVSTSWMPKLGAFSQCMNKVFLPTAKIKVDDGPLSANVENYKEFFYAMVGQAGEGQVFDGNGFKLRLQTVGGATKIRTGARNYTPQESLFANVTAQPAATSPSFSPTLPPIRTDVPCAKNAVPDVNGPAATGAADGSQPTAAAPKAPDLTAIPGGAGR
jgi:virulence factor Mce-like protein